MNTPSRLMFQFICPDGHEFEMFAYHYDEPDCVVCGKVSSKKITAPHISVKMGVDPSSTQANRWAKMHKDEAKRQNALIDPDA